ncbi:MAG: hypothetical protein ACXW2Q_08215 [Thermoanaerobaculia bacterium]
MSATALLRRIVAGVRLRRYARQYPQLVPLDYDSRKFAAVSEQARDLLVRAGRGLPPLPEDALQGYWIDNLNRFRLKLTTPLPETFLSERELIETMVRRGWGADQLRELGAVRQSPLYREIVERFVESRVGSPYLECEELRCATATLGYFYYLARIADFRARAGMTGKPERVCEVGGGYGGFARVYIWAHGPRQYNIIDLPEYNAVQFVFLSLSLDGVPVKMLTHPDDRLLDEGVNLYPVNLLWSGAAHPSCDFFSSTFALTESGEAVRRQVYAGRFFGAREVYYAGQTSARWPVSVDPEVLDALSAERGWETTRVPFYLPDCVEMHGVRRSGGTD